MGAAEVADPGSAYHMPPGSSPRAMRIPGEAGMPTEVRQTVNQTVQQAISQTVHLTGNVTLDGKVVGSIVADGIARGLNLPSNGPLGPDVRSTVPQTDTPW